MAKQSFVRQIIVHSRLRELLDYDPETGVFRWRCHRGGRARAGDIAGAVNSGGYRFIRIKGEGRYLAHRLAWFYVHGEWPVGMLDHANHDQLDNRLANLRPATMRENRGNSKVRSDNLTGLKGVSRQRGTSRLVARITKNGKQLYLGSFATAEEAHAAYCKAAEEIFGEFARAA
jgi:hypothetical protein